MAVEYAWSQTEPALAILCACLTTYRPLLHTIRLGTPKLLFTRRSHHRTERNSHRNTEGDWTDMENFPTSRIRVPVAREFEGQRGGNNQRSGNFHEIPLDPLNGGLHILDLGNVRYFPCCEN